MEAVIGRDSSAVSVKTTLIKLAAGPPDCDPPRSLTSLDKTDD